MSRRLGQAVAGIVTIALAAGLGIAADAGTAPTRGQAHAATPYDKVTCGDAAARLFQLRGNGKELWYSSISGPASTKPTVYGWRKIYTFNAARPALAVAAHDSAKGVVQLFVTDRDGGLRLYNFSTGKAAITSTKNLHTGDPAKPGPYDYSRLTSDGRRLYGTKGGNLYIATGVTATQRPKKTALVKTIGYPLALWSNAGNDQELFYTDTSGTLRAADVTTQGGGFTATITTIRTSGWSQAAITSPGAGLLVRDTPTNTWRHLVTLPTRQTDTKITPHQTISTTHHTPNLPVTTPPAECGIDSSPGGSAAVTYDQLHAMFGAKVASRAVVETGLPGLIREMQAGHITTPARKAAFLATVVNESTVNYAAAQNGSSTYRGRGFIQLTGDFNYRGAGNALGTDLLGNPSRAATLAWSDKISRWYWTKARPNTNRYADRHDMGMVNVQIGFFGSSDPSHPEVAERCRDFKNAYKVLTGSMPTSVECTT
ncbi:glycoside hydrolase family 19 protein [Tenggerimyces flavus]|uniref:Glycoside hydrolase family 19 protein n=1 Tax=Tenggerimyces flavus TaxID=1708749 RepID=A0ABV7YL05_9ACTN|nr:glycoside hydrolase family 19 protein [Tenggerimyces flavus]MBM7784728.1 putative chitinase [Tenggerimyces flavus]